MNKPKILLGYPLSFQISGYFCSAMGANHPGAHLLTIDLLFFPVRNCVVDDSNINVITDRLSPFYAFLPLEPIAFLTGWTRFGPNSKILPAHWKLSPLVLEHSVMFPFDAIKTRMQILTPSSPQAAYSSLSQALSRILTTEGFRSLWRGVSSVVLGAGPAHAIYFSVYEKAKEAKIGSAFLESAVGKDGARHAGHAMAGICAVVAHDAFMNPFDGALFLVAIFEG